MDKVLKHDIGLTAAQEEDARNKAIIIRAVKQLRNRVGELRRNMKSLMNSAECFQKDCEPLKEYFGEDWSQIEGICDVSDLLAFLNNADEVFDTLMALNDLDE